MKVGNKMHAVGLSVIVVGAVFGLILQMKARMSPAPARPGAAIVTPAAAAPALLVSLPHLVYGDPFTHPKLPRFQVALKTDVAASGVEQPSSGSQPRPLTGDLNYSPLVPDLPRALGGPAKPSSPARKALLIYLQAIVSTPDPVAFISIDGKEPQQFDVGDTLANGVIVTRIAEGEIELHLSKGSKTLHVGSKVKL